MSKSQIDRAAIETIAAASKSRLDMWVRLIDLTQIHQMAEVGVWKGEFAEVVLRACPAVQCYFMIDPWRRLDQWNKPMNIDDHAFETIYNEALRRTEFAGDRRIVLRGTTLEVIGDIPDASLDFVYIDGDHTLRGITTDLLNVWRKAKPGGWIGGDDLFANIWQHGLEFEPTLVFPFVLYFAEAVGAPIYALPQNQFLVEKPRGASRNYVFHDLVGWYGDPTLRRQMIVPPRRWTNLLPMPLKRTLRRLFNGYAGSGERPRRGAA